MTPLQRLIKGGAFKDFSPKTRALIEDIAKKATPGPIERPPEVQAKLDRIAKTLNKRRDPAQEAPDGVPPVWQGYRFTTSPAPPYEMDKARRFVDKDVILIGTNGSGKTGLAVSALYHRGNGLYMDANDFLVKAVRRHDPLVGDIVAELSGSREFLVLDDLPGADDENITPAARREVGNLIHKRQANGFKTWITTNLDLAGDDGAPGIRELYGLKAYDRLRDYQVVALTGKSKRGQR